MLKVENIEFSYGTEKVLQNISFEINKGSFCGIIGPNGSGKTTLIKILVKILRQKKGRITLEGRETRLIPAGEYAKKISYLPSITELPFSYTVEEFVMLGRFPYIGRYGKVSKEDRNIVEIALEQLGINKHRRKKVWELSDGEKQRVFIAQVLAQQSSVIILDEPTSHLDIGHSFRIMDIIKEVNREGITVITVLHDLNLASEYCTQLFLLNNGKIFAKETPEEVITYQNIEAVYNTKVLVYTHPLRKKPHVFGISSAFMSDVKQ